MELDLRRDSRRIREHIAQRAHTYDGSTDLGPGAKGDPVTQITLGFEFDQGGWVVLVFDTRPDSEPDGEWNSHIEGNMLEFPLWQTFFDSVLESGDAGLVTLPDGTSATLRPDDENEMASLIGEMLAEAITDAKEDGVFTDLPLSAAWRMTVEHHTGAYGWPGVEECQQEEQAQEELEARVSALPRADQLELWIAQLEHLARGQDCETSRIDEDSEYVLEQLDSFGHDAIVPMLTFACGWSDKVEWEGDNEATAIELPFAEVVLRVLWKIRDSGCATQEVERLLGEFVSKSVAVNAGRRLWGTNPFHAAYCLHNLFDYPEPIMAGNNRLGNAAEFLAET